MTHINYLRKTLSFISLVAVALLGACASSVPTAKFAKELPAANRVAQGDTYEISVDAAEGTKLANFEKTRFSDLIRDAIKEKMALNPAKPQPEQLSIEIKITRYDKGNAFARSMLAGLGQIHIDGTIRVLSGAEKNLIAEFDLKKTFAWGGLYGATTSIEDIEATFARGIAETLTGQADKKK